MITEPEYWRKEFVKPLSTLGDLVTGRFSRKELLTQISDTDVLLIRVETKVDAEVLDAARNLKVIASMTTGLNHIDLEGAKKRGIRVLSTPGYATFATAEYTLALILSLARNITWAAEDFGRGKWERQRFIGTELAGKTIGIVGFGRIGKRVGQYCNALDMRVLYYDPYVNDVTPTGAERAESLEYLLAESDIVTLQAIQSIETERIIRSETLAKMKRHAMLVNTARGAMVDVPDLITALEKGIIGGAALDVFSEEPLPSTNPLLEYSRKHQNLLLTPHMAGSTHESTETGARQIVKSLLEMYDSSGKWRTIKSK